MREQASAAERRASAISLSSLSPQRSSYYVLSRMNFRAVVEHNAAYLFCAIGLQMEL